MISGRMMRDAFISGANRVAEKSAEMNRINLFPVADGDTGANLTVTLGMAKQRLLRLGETTLPGSAERAAGDKAREEGQESGVSLTPAEVLSEAANYMLRASRGNSGAILSAMVRGMAAYLMKVPGRPETEISEEQFFRALFSGEQMAVSAVSAPADGTMLTVAKKTARAGMKAAETRGVGGIREGKPAGQTEEEPGALRSCAAESDEIGVKDWKAEMLWGEVLEAAHRGLTQTRFEMELLWENDVVDAGALGFVSFLEGMAQVFQGGDICPEPKTPDVERPYVFDREKVLRTDGALPAVTHVLRAEFSGREFRGTEFRKKMEPLTERMTLFRYQEGAETKFNTDDLAGAVQAAADTGCLRKLTGFAHSANFKIRFGTYGGSPTEELLPERMTAGAHEAETEKRSGEAESAATAVPEGRPRYRMALIFLKETGANGVAEELRTGMDGYGYVLIEEDEDTIQLVAFTEAPASILRIFSGKCNEGFVTDLRIDSVSRF